MTKDKHFNDISVNIVKDDGNYAKLVAEPFDRGYATTIGNSLRRILLTSIPGAAITSIKIDGVEHEFSNIKGVLEDVSQVIQNLKKVRFSLNDFGPELISFDIQGPCEFTAKDIDNHITQFNVINKDLVIANVTDKVKLKIDLRISRGKGYVPSEKNKRNDDVIGVIPIDSVFSPITNVSWKVEPIATSTEEEERLVMEVTSDGSTTPKDAINHSASIARQHLAFFMFNESESIKAVNEEEITEALEIKGLLLKSIDEMELSVRSHNCLQAAGIETIGELVDKEEGEMLRYKNFGRKSLTELVHKLDQLNLKFGMDVSQYLNAE
ncbi:MAG: DNA-directed RNA polymerase subunit alpha [Candidatus Marinimicrobia bacterium]|nr:DNA-directed RNA polymerase subunit alpha [Candidatus Neomarinimicrobiota bacterium]|tara:strand:- start:9136 stop:10107 length:972 start_codon:yes stop_codon:yes gene_type:complete